MQLTKIMKFILPLLLIVGTNQVSAEYDIGQCVDLLTSAMSTSSTCEAMKIYMKCVVKEMNLHTLGLTDSVLQIIQDQMDAQFAEQGSINCDLDIAAIVEQVRQEESTGSDGTTRRPPTFETSATLGDCITSLTNAGIKAGGITCSLARDYTKCAIRVLNFLDQNPTSQDIQIFKETMETQLQQQGLSCSLDVQTMINEIQAEKNGGSLTTTTSKMPTTTWNFDLSSGDYNDCVNELQNSENNQCTAVNNVMKCVLRKMSNNYDRLTSMQKKQIEDQFHQFLKLYANIDCYIDMDALAQEVRREGNGADAELRPLHRVSMALITMFSILVVNIILW